MTRGTDGSTPRGQSLVEFALVLPMLLVLLLGIADFGRAFAMGIALEASARDAAEIGALERLRTRPPTDPLLLDAYYEDLHETISRTACEEMEVHPEPELAYQAGTAALAGAVLTSFYLVSPFVGGELLLKAFVVMVIGGMGNVVGALLGGLIVGVVESIASVFVTASLGNAIVFALLILILLVRPSGLFRSETGV